MYRHQIGVESTLKYNGFLARYVVNGEICVSSGRRNPLEKGVKFDEFDKPEPQGDWPFCELVGCLMWLANQTPPDSANEVRAVAMYTNSPRKVHWKTAVGILGTSGFCDEYSHSVVEEAHVLIKESFNFTAC